MLTSLRPSGPRDSVRGGGFNELADILSIHCCYTQYQLHTRVPCTGQWWQWRAQTNLKISEPRQLARFSSYRLLHQNRDKSKSKNFINGKFKKWFYFLTCISPDYVSHESSKEFWKNSHYWNMRAGFLRGVKKHFGKIALKWCIFRHEKSDFLANIML